MDWCRLAGENREIIGSGESGKINQDWEPRLPLPGTTLTRRYKGRLIEVTVLESGFEYNLRVGFSYTFGSIFSNVVNPRFGGSTRFFIREF